MPVVHHYQKLQTIILGSFQQGIENEKQITPCGFHNNIIVSFTGYGFKITVKQNRPTTVLMIIFLLHLKIQHITRIIHFSLYIYNIMFLISTQLTDYIVGSALESGEQ